jgi:choline dehydrogenase-like flavoprotein
MRPGVRVTNASTVQERLVAETRHWVRAVLLYRSKFSDCSACAVPNSHPNFDLLWDNVIAGPWGVVPLYSVSAAGSDLFLDFESNAESPQAFDVCVVGGGVVGLVTAWALAHSQLRVIVIEAGGLRDELRSQSLYETAEFTGLKNNGVTDGRFRVYGGTGTRWTAQLAPAELTAWPIKPHDLEPYFEKIGEMLGLGDTPFDASCYKILKRQPLDFDDDMFSVRFSKGLPWKKRNIGRYLKKAFEKSRDTTVLLHANAVEIILDEEDLSLVSAIRIRSYDGRERLITANDYILAAGAIEISRLLLASRNQMPQGVGNRYDNVGRWFMDHVCVRAGYIVPKDRKKLLQGIRPVYVGDVLHTPRFELTKAQSSCRTAFVHIVFEAHPVSAFSKLRTLFHDIQREGGKAMSRSPFWSILSDMPDVMAGFISHTALGLRPIPARSTPVVSLVCEQPPRRESRIFLADAIDAIGLPKIRVNWLVGEEEKTTLLALGRLFEQQLIKSKSGAIQWFGGFNPAGAAFPAEWAGWYHHIGGARMSVSPTEGVVDTDCRVHGVSNLYIVGSAVFPTSNCSHPTFTSMALALRLVAKLHGRRASA